jgi:hypothetical protein
VPGISITALRVAALVGVLAGASSARAQRAPDLATLDRGDGISKVGIDIGLSLLDGPYTAALRLEPYGQYVTRSGLGVYGALPIARSFGGSAAAGQPHDTFAVGNFDLGLLFVVQATAELSWVFRGGVGFPLASDDADGILTNVVATFPRLTDLSLTVPDAFYVRVGVSPLLHLRRVYFRVDLGADVGSDDADAADELLRFNVGGGIDLGSVALGVELVNLASLDRFSGNERYHHAVAGTIRVMGSSFQPQFALGVPLDASNRDAVNLFVTAGLQYVPR